MNANRREFLKFLAITSLSPSSLFAYEHSYHLEQSSYFMNPEELSLVISIDHKLLLVEQYVGHGNFNVMSFDSALHYARNYTIAFTKQEIDFIDDMFHRDAKEIDFFGERTSKSLTYEIPLNKTIKMSNGQYLYKEESLAKYEELQKFIGDELVLTSGIRSNIKQAKLFFGAIIKDKGNLQLAANRLAPIGYSFHGVGDFDIGKRGFSLNFSQEFADTDVYQKLSDNHMLKLRYSKMNKEHVQFEPWHFNVFGV